MLNIAVVFGGKSVEHDISIITGTLTLNSLDKTLYNPIPIYIDNKGLWWTGDLFNLGCYKNFDYKKCSRVTFSIGENFLFKIKKTKLKAICKIDCLINCTHGYNGEDGSIFALARLNNLAIVSPDMFCSSFALDKEKTKIVLKGISVKTLPYKVCKKCEFLQDSLTCLKNLQVEFPVIVKPARLGSSIGISTAKDFKQLCLACQKGFKYDDKLLIEPLIENFTEINCACYQADKLVVSQCEKPFSGGEFLSFEDKYSGKGQREFPAKISQTLQNKIKSTTKKIYSVLAFEGIIRIDYIIKDNKIYLNEINTIPGSLAYYLFCQDVAEFKNVLTDLIKRAILCKQNYSKNQFEFSSQILLDASNLKK